MFNKAANNDWAKVYTAKMIEAGVCTYDDGVVLVKNPALHMMAPTMKGKPVIIRHDSEMGYKITPENMKNHAVGYVVNVEYNKEAGYFESKFVVFDEAAKALIDEGYKVSCAYIPTKLDNAGLWHRTPYDVEILDGEYTHLALVERARYEDAVVYENSVKSDDRTIGESKMSLFKIFQTKKEEIDVQDAHVQLENGDTKSLDELVENYKASQKAKDNLITDLNASVMVDGTRVTISELINCAEKKDASENSDDKVDDKEEEKTEENKNSDSDDEKDTDKDENKENKSDDKQERQNSAFFNKLENAAPASATKPSMMKNYKTLEMKTELGRMRYGSPSSPKAQ